MKQNKNEGAALLSAHLLSSHPDLSCNTTPFIQEWVLVNTANRITTITLIKVMHSLQKKKPLLQLALALALLAGADDDEEAITAEHEVNTHTHTHTLITHLNTLYRPFV